MKKVLTLLLAALMIVSLLPMAVLAEAPTEVKVKIYNGTAKDFTMTLADGDEVYLVAGEEGKDLIKWTETEAPTDKFVSFAYAADTGVLKTTFKNLVTDQFDAGGYTCHGIWYQSGDYKVEIELIGENSMTHSKSACIKNENSGGMTITGAGSLSLNIGTSEKLGSASGALWTNGGDLLIKDTTINFKVLASESAKHHSILAGKGNVTIENSKITTDTLGGQLVYTGLSTHKDVRFTMDPNPERFIKVKNCEITATANKTIFESINPVTIQNTTMKITLKGSSGPAFSPAPTFEGDFSAIAGLRKNAEKLDKLKEYDPKKLSSYTYIYMVPGIVELLPTEPPTEATEPEVTVPEVTQPEATEPATEPATQPATQPEATQPATQPTETTPNATEPVDTDAEEGGSPLKVVLIVLIALVVVAGAGIAVLFVLKKKGIVK